MLVGLRSAATAAVKWILTTNPGCGHADCTQVRANHASPRGLSQLRHCDILGAIEVAELADDTRKVVLALTVWPQGGTLQPRITCLELASAHPTYHALRHLLVPRHRSRNVNAGAIEAKDTAAETCPESTTVCEMRRLECLPSATGGAGAGLTS